MRGFDPPTMGKVSLEIVQLSIECVDPTLDCYVAVARSLGVNTILFGQIARGPREGELQVTVSLLDAAGKRWIKRATKLFPSEDDAAYDQLMALGARVVPVTVIGGEVIMGFDLARLRAALAAGAGGSSPDR